MTEFIRVLDLYAQKRYDEFEMILTQEIKSDRAKAFEFLKYCLQSSGSTKIVTPHELIYYVSPDRFIEIFAFCLPALGLNYKEAERSGISLQHYLLEHLSWQAPGLFHTHLENIWEKSVDELAQAWQDSGEIHHTRLVECLEDESRASEHRQALLRLELSNCVAGFELARQYGKPQDTIWMVVDDEWKNVPNTQGLYLLETAGVEFRDGSWHRLYNTASYHFKFPEEALEAHNSQANEHMKLNDDSWKLTSTADTIRYGGVGSAGCPICERESHHLFTLKTAPAGFDITTPIVFESCLYCMMSSRPMYAHHDDSGRPTIEPSYQVFERTYEPKPLQEMTVSLSQTPDRFYRQEWSGVQNLSRLGGPATWIQGPEHEICPSCNKRMLFLSQLGDGIDYIHTTIYIFWCNSCRISAVLNTYT
ncbi:hypothetical protein [Deinococcus sp.]|uniref:hypothetical protein n=1 Tax=Deinococcus sp. TaxID=47478 RepID=UPI003C7C2CFE